MCFFSKKIQLYSLQMNLKCLVDEDELLADSKNWLGWQDSNLRMTGSKPVALPLGDIPIV